MTGQEKCDLLIQVTAWVSLTIYWHVLSLWKRVSTIKKTMAYILVKRPKNNGVNKIMTDTEHI
jgi:hypothetical protein